MKTIPLTQGCVALVDNADYPAVSAHKWFAVKVGRRVYAARKVRRPDGGRTMLYLHQFLIPNAEEVDHIDGDGRNNARDNLRPATRLQNARGFQRKRRGASSQYRGVAWDSHAVKWMTSIRVNGKNLYLGLFSDEETAARAYDTAARKYYGDRASLNFL